MTFVTDKGSRQLSQGLSSGKFTPESNFSDTFGASVGLIFDEELTISSLLNKEGYQQRADLVRSLKNDDSINLGKYQSNEGFFDYDRIAKDLPDLGVKTDRQLYEERNETLAKRRNYAQKVIDRGSGFASVLGSLTGYVLDPLTISTLPLGGLSSSAKGLGILGQALNVAKNEALVGVATELAIQPFVYNHKQDINSPYSVKDAAQSVAFAALGGALIGGATGGISGYLSKVNKDLKGNLTDEASVDALESLERLKDNLDDLKTGRELDFEDATKSVIQKRTDELTENLSAKLSDEDLLTYRKVIENQDLPAKEKLEAQSLIEADTLARKSEIEINEISKGKLSPELEKKVARAKAEYEIEEDRKLLENFENVRETYNARSSDLEIIEPRQTTGSRTATERQRDVLTRRGIEQDYDADIAAYEALEDPQLVVNDEITKAGKFFDGLDSEINGLDEVLRCAIA